MLPILNRPIWEGSDFGGFLIFSGTNLLCRISGDFVDFELCSKCDWIRFPFCYFLLLFVTFELQIATRWSSKRFKSDWWHNMQFMMDFAWFLLSLFWIHSSLMFCIHWTVFPDENAMDNCPIRSMKIKQNDFQIPNIDENLIERWFILSLNILYSYEVFIVFVIRFFDFFTLIFLILSYKYLLSGTNLLCRISGDFVDFELCSKCDSIRFPFCYFLLLFVTFELQIATRWSSKRFKSDWLVVNG